MKRFKNFRNKISDSHQKSKRFLRSFRNKFDQKPQLSVENVIFIAK